MSLISTYTCVGQHGVERVFQRFDDFMQTCYDEITDNCITRRSARYADYYSPVLDIAAGAGGLILASKYHKHITFNSVTIAASGTYFANRLSPDWLKDFCSHVPLLHYLVSNRRMRDKGSRSPSYAVAEYALMAGIAWAIRQDFRVAYLVPCVALAYMARLLTSSKARDNVLKIPVLRRLV